MVNPETTEMAFKNGQSGDNRNGIQQWGIQRQQKWHLGIDNPKTQWTHVTERRHAKNLTGWKTWTTPTIMDVNPYAREE
jgi:hypothetical protein